MDTILIILISLLTFYGKPDSHGRYHKQPDPDLPYRQIPDYPASFTPENVAARMIDGLGYRYYWATEGLRPEDLLFRPDEGARSTEETIHHIYGLSQTILNASLNQANIFPRNEPERSFEEIRKRTLENFQEASEILKSNGGARLDNLKVIFGSGDNTSEYPYWNMLNGPIADAIYHTGQVVSFRRSSGNPINPNVRVFLGITSE